MIEKKNYHVWLVTYTQRVNEAKQVRSEVNSRSPIEMVAKITKCFNLIFYNNYKIIIPLKKSSTKKKNLNMI